MVAGSRGVDFSVSQLSRENVNTPNESRKKISDEALYGKDPALKNDATEAFMAILKQWDLDGVGKISPVQGKSSSVTGAKMNDDMSRVLDDYRAFKRGTPGTSDREDWVDEDYSEHRANLNIGDIDMSKNLEKLGALVWASVIAPQTKTAGLNKTAAPKIDIKRLFKLLGLGAMGTLGVGAGGFGTAGMQTPEGQKAWEGIKQSGGETLQNISDSARDILNTGGESIQDIIGKAYGEAKGLGAGMLQRGAEAAGSISEGTDDLKNYISSIKNGGLNFYSDLITGIFGEE